jgi:hypothetical protein
MMIYSNQNLHQKLRIHLVRIGKLLIAKLQQKILLIVEIIIIQIIVVLQLILVDIVQHQNQQQHHMIMVMLKNVFLMRKEYQVINFLIKIPM